jgi:hypothetical protein
MPLDAAQQRTALQRIAAWRLDPKQLVACPACEREGLVVIDRSARPYAEWYALSCAFCGLDQTLHVPLGPPVPTLD